MTPLSRPQILLDLQEIFVAAMEEKNFAIALKAKELQAKELELVDKRKSLVDLDNLTESDLERILRYLESQESTHMPE